MKMDKERVSYLSALRNTARGEIECDLAVVDYGNGNGGASVQLHDSSSKRLTHQ